MSIVIAPDSFKESLCSIRVAQAIGRGWSSVYPDADIFLCPMADGGEGTIDALLSNGGGKRYYHMVEDPLSSVTEACWAVVDNDTAIIEMAAASGLHHIPTSKRDVLRASSYGTGELIKAALDVGVKRIILGLGGTATNDAGMGCMKALGVRFLDDKNRELSSGGGSLAQLKRIDLSFMDPRIRTVQFDAVVDVNNPLYGPEGASLVFGPQKGASVDDAISLDKNLEHLAVVMKQALQQDFSQLSGSGAAGGMGFMAKALLEAQFYSGVEFIANVVGLPHKIKNAHLVITGEGCFDGQSLMGKTPIGIARLAKKTNTPVIVLAGKLGEEYQLLYDEGVTAAFSLASGPMSLTDAIEQTEESLQSRTADIARIWRASKD
ncbi:UNVERIFIED_CONTAM: hypothetical protein GTU68_005046 [Idotea baltica]|nr:hypothetical protein [Idotea baltica]